MKISDLKPLQNLDRARDEEELKPGPIWGGWWFWEPPPGKTKESAADTLRRQASNWFRGN